MTQQAVQNFFKLCNTVSGISTTWVGPTQKTLINAAGRDSIN